MFARLLDFDIPASANLLVEKRIPRLDDEIAFRATFKHCNLGGMADTLCGFDIQPSFRLCLDTRFLKHDLERTGSPHRMIVFPATCQKLF